MLNFEGRRSKVNAEGLEDSFADIRVFDLRLLLVRSLRPVGHVMLANGESLSLFLCWLWTFAMQRLDATVAFASWWTFQVD